MLISLYEIFVSDTPPQQECVVSAFNRSRDWPCDKRCPTIRGRRGQNIFLCQRYSPRSRRSVTVAQLFDRLASSYGSHFPGSFFSRISLVCPPLVLHYARTLLQWRELASVLDQPGDFWDSRHQRTCVGRWISNKDKSHTKLLQTHHIPVLQPFLKWL